MGESAGERSHLTEPLVVRHAAEHDVDWIVDLSRRVQEALTAAGSRQRIGPLPRADVESTVRAGHGFLLEVPSGRLGSVLVDPAAGYPALPLAAWGLDALPAPHWYLHALMLEPSHQGRGLGQRFLDGVREWVVPDGRGTIILDCWAGNQKLRDFYHRAGFSLFGVFPVGDKGFEVAVFVSSPLAENRGETDKARHHQDV